MSREFITALLERYRYHSCLWQLTCKDYMNKKKRDEAYDDLVRFSKNFEPEIDKAGLMKKLNYLFANFNEELTKFVTTREMYKPKIWYYDLLLFLKDESLSVPCLELEERLKGKKGRVRYSEDTSTSLAVSKCESAKTIKRKFMEDDSSETSSQNFNMVECKIPNRIDEYEAIGIAWAAKLRKLDLIQKVLVEGLVTKVLEMGYFQELTRNTIIQDNSTSHQVNNEIEQVSSSFEC